MMTAKDELKQSFWSLFESPSQVAPEEVPSDMIQPPSVLNPSNDTKALSGNTDIIGDLVNKLNDVNVEVPVENKRINEFQSGEISKKPSEEISKPFELNAELKNILSEAFEKMNKDSFYIEPMLIPIVPNTDQKILQLEI